MEFCCPLLVYRLYFAWNCGWVTFLEKDKFNLQRVVGKQRNWQWIFPQNVAFFCECNFVRIGQNIKTRYRWKDLIHIERKGPKPVAVELTQRKEE